MMIADLTFGFKRRQDRRVQFFRQGGHFVHRVPGAVPHDYDRPLRLFNQQNGIVERFPGQPGYPAIIYKRQFIPPKDMLAEPKESGR